MTAEMRPNRSDRGPVSRELRCGLKSATKKRPRDSQSSANRGTVARDATELRRPNKDGQECGLTKAAERWPSFGSETTKNTQDR